MDFRGCCLRYLAILTYCYVHSGPPSQMLRRVLRRSLLGVGGLQDNSAPTRKRMCCDYKIMIPGSKTASKCGSQ